MRRYIVMTARGSGISAGTCIAAACTPNGTMHARVREIAYRSDSYEHIPINRCAFFYRSHGSLAGASPFGGRIRASLILIYTSITQRSVQALQVTVSPGVDSTSLQSLDYAPERPPARSRRMKYNHHSGNDADRPRQTT